MPRFVTFALFLLAVFLQAGAYGLTYMLARLFQSLGANEKAVGMMLMIAAASTLIAVYYSGHLSDWLRPGQDPRSGMPLDRHGAGALTARREDVGAIPVLASLLLGAGWGLTYTLAPVVLTRLVTARRESSLFCHELGRADGGLRPFPGHGV